MDYLFDDIRKILQNRGLELKDKIFFTSLLELSQQNKENYVSIADVKNKFFFIISETKTHEDMVNKAFTSRQLNESRSSRRKLPEIDIQSPSKKHHMYVSDMDYLRKIILEDSANISKNKLQPLTVKHQLPIRRDIFEVKAFHRQKDKKTIILNENKLESIYS